MKKALFLILIFFPFLSMAQPPGYQGKRFIASYNMDIAPNLTYIYVNLDRAVPLQLFLNHHLNVEYVLWRRFSVGADFSFSQNNPAILDSGNKAHVTTTTLGLNFIFYPNNSNTIAPVGNYFKIKVFEGNASSTGRIFENANTGWSNYNSPNQKIYGFGVGFGNNMIVHNNVCLTASINIDLNMPFVNGDPLQADVESYLLTSYLFYLKLGIGGLLF